MNKPKENYIWIPQVITISVGILLSLIDDELPKFYCIWAGIVFLFLALQSFKIKKEFFGWIFIFWGIFYLFTAKDLDLGIGGNGIIFLVSLLFLGASLFMIFKENENPQKMQDWLKFLFDKIERGVKWIFTI